MVWWHNQHRTIEREITDWRAPVAGGGANPFDRFAALAQAYGAIPGACTGPGIITLGTAWSFSALLAGQATTIATDAMGAIQRLSAAQAAPSPGNPGGAMVLVGAGTKLRDLNFALEGRHGPDDLSIRTSGSYDGQSLAGLIGTGVHGSRLGFGAFQNQVRGVHLVTGPGQSVWIEPGPQPILDPAIVAAISTRPPIYDADVFAATQVHLGGLGIVSAVLFEAAPFCLFDVVKTMKRLTRADIAMLAAGDFAGFARACGRDARPDFVEVVCDPFTPWSGEGIDPVFESLHAAMITFYFAVPAAATTAIDRAASRTVAPARQSLDTLLDAVLGHEAIEGLDHLVEDAFDLFPPGLFYPLLAHSYQSECGVTRMSWGKANGHYTPRTIGPVEIPLHNDSFAVPRDRLPETLGRIGAAFREQGGGHLVFTLRFVSGAQGLMAFTRFPETAVINVDGIRTGRSHEAAVRMLAALERDPAIPFSQHWGKMGNITAARVIREFGDPAAPTLTPARRWRLARERLLDPAMRTVFASDALRAWGLA